MRITLDLTDPEAVALATVIREARPPADMAAAWNSALEKLTPQLHGMIFKQLKSELLEALAEVDAGKSVPAEEMRRMFGLRPKP